MQAEICEIRDFNRRRTRGRPQRRDNGVRVGIKDLRGGSGGGAAEKCCILLVAQSITMLRLESQVQNLWKAEYTQRTNRLIASSNGSWHANVGGWLRDRANPGLVLRWEGAFRETMSLIGDKAMSPLIKSDEEEQIFEYSRFELFRHLVRILFLRYLGRILGLKREEHLYTSWSRLEESTGLGDINLQMSYRSSHQKDFSRSLLD